MEFTRVSHRKVPFVIFGEPHVPNVHAKPVEMGFPERPGNTMDFDGSVRTSIFHGLADEFDPMPIFYFAVVGLPPFLYGIGLLYLVPQPISNGSMFSQVRAPMKVDVVPVFVFCIPRTPSIVGIPDVRGDLELLVDFVVSAKIEYGIIEPHAILIESQLML